MSALPTLLPSQVDYMAMHESKINSEYYFVNKGEMGSGKTITTIYLALKYKKDLLVIGPKNIQRNWEDECFKFKVKMTFISYPLLSRGNSGYVERKGDIMVPTQLLINLINTGPFVVYDEAQDVKNPKAKCFLACNEISKCVIKQNSGARIMILSATLIDKPEYAESTFKLAGIITKKELFFYNPGTKVYTLKGYGYEEAMSYCAKLNPSATSKCVPKTINAKQLRIVLFNLSCDVIMPNMSFLMRKPQIKAQFYPKLGYYKLSNDDDIKLKKAIDDLKKSVRYNPDNKTILYTNDTMRGVILAHHNIERAKMPLFERLALETLKNVENSKVILFLWYTDSIDYLMEKLKAYNPLKLNGSVNAEIRYDQLNARFMQANNNCRLIIAHPKAAGVGLSYDDRFGDFPRYSFMSSNYHFIPIHQSAGRTHRPTTKSDAHFSIVYGRDAIEHSIMDALSRKTETLQGINACEDIIYPAFYPVHIET